MTRQTLSAQEFLAVPLGSGTAGWSNDCELRYTALFASAFHQSLEKNPVTVSEETIQRFFSPDNWQSSIDSIWFNNYELYGNEEQARFLSAEFLRRLEKACNFVLADFRTAVPAVKNYASAVSPRRSRVPAPENAILRAGTRLKTALRP